MPIIKSAKKRVRIASKAAVRNSKTKRSLRTAIKAFQADITTKNADSAQSAIDIAVKKGVIHKNKAARKKKQLAEKAKQAKSAPAKKAVAKKAPTSKKPVAKKPVAKKTAAKKTTAKK